MAKKPNPFMKKGEDKEKMKDKEKAKAKGKGKAGKKAAAKAEFQEVMNNYKK